MEWQATVRKSKGVKKTKKMSIEKAYMVHRVPRQEEHCYCLGRMNMRLIFHGATGVHTPFSLPEMEP